MPEKFPCEQCGAWLNYTPGTAHLTCPYCTHATEVVPESDAVPVAEQDFVSWLEYGGVERVSTHVEHTIACPECGASTSTTDAVTATNCSYCGHAIVAKPTSTRMIPPTGMIPFAINKAQSRDRLRRWLGSRRFAPNALTKEARSNDPLRGIYTPYWTFDSRTITDYRGERGDYYWVTETYTTHVHGKAQSRTRRVRKTRWRSARGRVPNIFDDVLVLATNSIPSKYADRLSPWPLGEAVPYEKKFLAGFQAETYRLNLAQGFGRAKRLMEPKIRRTIHRDIGGDEQRIHSMDTKYYQVTFKHLLLPVWISTYRYKGKPYTFLVNGRTGEVQGDRPYSRWKIAGLILLVVGLIAAAITFFMMAR